MADNLRRPGGAAGVDDGMDVRVGVARRLIAVRTDYRSALQLAQRLEKAGFPTQQLEVVGADLREATRERGRLSTGEVTGRGALSGLLVGAAVGWLLWLFDLITGPLAVWWLVINAAVLGAVLGAGVALLGYVITQGGRSFAADDPVRSGRFEILADADAADHAVRLLTRNQPAAGSAEHTRPS